MAQEFLIPVVCQPGIKKDNTDYASEFYIDGEWVRFYDNSPMKIAGYQFIYFGTLEIIRSLYDVNQSTTVNVYIGRLSGITYVNLSSAGLLLGVEVNRTPASYTPVTGNIWSFDTMTIIDGTSASSYLIAHVAPNDTNVNNLTEGPVFLGLTTNNSPLAPVLSSPSNIVCSGGIVVALPFLIVYGNNGFIRWCAAGDPTSWPTMSPNINYGIIANTLKIIAAVNIRDQSNISLLFWCVDQLVRATYDPVNNVFNPVILDPTITIIAKRSVCEYSNIYYWIGTGQFYAYDGIVRKLPNNQYTQYFFDNVNRDAQSRIFTTIVKKYGEIWFHWPFGSSTECNQVLIYNTEYQTWYDTPLNRTCSVNATALLPFPLMADSQTVVDPAGGVPVANTYGIWMHESGVDKVLYGNNYAIKSRFVSKFFSLIKDNPQNNICLSVMRFENDFVQTGNLQIRLLRRAWPNTPIVYSKWYTVTPTTEKVDFDNEDRQGRLFAIEVQSNAAGGNYLLGRSQFVVMPGAVRPQPTEVTS